MRFCPSSNPFQNHSFGHFQGQTGIARFRRYSTRISIVLFFLLISAFIDANYGSTAHAASRVKSGPIVPAASRMKHAAAATACSSTSPTFCWHGGPIQHDPKVYLVFWGSEWNTDTESEGVKSQVIGLFQHLAGGNYHNILPQYYDGNGQGDNTLTLKDTQVDDTHPIPPNISMDTLLQEAENANIEFNWPAWDISTQIMIFPQKGTSYSGSVNIRDGACGEHEYRDSLPFSFIRFMSTTDPNNLNGCGLTSNSAQDNITMVASHEYAETVTDPNPYTGWYEYQPCSTSGCNPDQEIGDLCNQNPASYSPANDPSATFNVQKLWSNAANGCVASDGNQYVSPASPGQHTVHGAILAEYMKVGQNTSVAGSPISEEIPMGNGLVQYFTERCSGASECAGIYWSPNTGAHLVWGADFPEYVKIGEAKSVAGFPVTDEMTMTDQFTGVSGSVQYYTERCSGASVCAGIYWSPSTGSHLVWGADFPAYRKVGEAASVAGFPVTEELSMNGGSVQYYTERCSGASKCAGIYWSSSTGSHLVWGSDFPDYVGVREANGPLAFPLTDEESITGGSALYFTANAGCGTPGPNGSDGAIYWSSGTGSHEVHGCVYAFYQQTSGGTDGVLGYPLSDETGITDYYGTSGRVNYFTANYGCGKPGPNGSDGAIYWTGAAYQVYGCIYATYMNDWSGPAGKLGFPTSSEYTNSAGYRETDFIGGSIVWNGGPVVTLNCVGKGTCN